MAVKKYKIEQLQQDESLLELHPETDADIVNVEKGTGKYPGQATNVQDALEEVYDMAQHSGVTGVKGDAENEYRTGNVNITPANVGAVPESAVSTDTPSASSTDEQIPTAKAVYALVNNLPEPMIFRGSLGTGGTITTLPAASPSNEGYTYKVITAGTYAGQAAKVGDVFISDGTNWVYIPSADEPSGTVISVGASGASGSHVAVSGGPITDSGTIVIGVESGYSIPSDNKQGQWDAKYDKPEAGIPKTDLAEGVQGSLDKADTAYQKPQNGVPSSDMSATGIVPGTYSAITVDAAGRATAGAQMIEVGASGATTPSANLAIGGIFFKEI